MRTLKLTHGPGDGISSACLMTASNMIIGRGEDRDKNSCVCPVIREFIIVTNDAIPESILGELYGPLVLEILGTKTEDLDTMRRRAYCFADWAVRTVVPIAQRTMGREAIAKRLEALNEIVDASSARAAKTTALEIDAATMPADAAVYVTAHPNAMTGAVYAANMAARTVKVAARLAGDDIWKLCPGIILQVASIGDRKPVDIVMTLDDLAASLGS